MRTRLNLFLSKKKKDFSSVFESTDRNPRDGPQQHTALDPSLAAKNGFCPGGLSKQVVFYHLSPLPSLPIKEQRSGKHLSLASSVEVAFGRKL